MTAPLDEPREVRRGEELDVERLAPWFRERFDLPAAATLTVRQFPSGHSNLTYLVSSGDQEWVLRRPPFGSKVKTAHDMGREFRILSRLAPVYAKAPRPLASADAEGPLGVPFYVMQRLRGVVLRKDLPPGLELSPGDVTRLHSAQMDGLAELHALDYEAAGLGDLGKPEGYVERQVKGWARRYQDSKTDELEAVDRLGAWLEEHRPPERASSLIHNDWKLDNLVLDARDPTRIVGVLDWEMSTLGDPFLDLGTTLSYWVEAGDPEDHQQLRWGPSTLPGSLTRQGLLDRYQQASGREVPDPVYYYAFGLFKTAVVLQQIYYRYKHGLTTDPRFAPLIFGVGILAEAALRAIDRGRL